MGERTQLLVSVKYGDEVKTSFSIHYQWGYGRIMLMDTLNLAWKLLLDGDYQMRELSTEEYTKILMEKSNGTRNFEHDEDYSSWGIVANKETIENVVNHSDNNDGYIHLKADFSEKCFSTLDIGMDFYTMEGKQVDFETYCYHSDGYEWTAPDFRNSFKGLLDALEVETYVY